MKCATVARFVQWEKWRVGLDLTIASNGGFLSLTDILKSSWRWAFVSLVLCLQRYVEAKQVRTLLASLVITGYLSKVSSDNQNTFGSAIQISSPIRLHSSTCILDTTNAYSVESWVFQVSSTSADSGWEISSITELIS